MRVPIVVLIVAAYTGCLNAGPMHGFAHRPFEKARAWIELVAAPMSGMGGYVGHSNIFLGLEYRSNEIVCFHCPNDKFKGLQSFKLGGATVLEGIHFASSIGVGQYKGSEWAVDPISQSETRMVKTRIAFPVEGQIAFGWEFLKFGGKTTVLMGRSLTDFSAAVFVAFGAMGDGRAFNGR